MYFKAFVFIPIGWLITIIAWILSPLVAIPYYYALRHDVVKRYNKRKVTLNRQYVVDWLAWFTTDDNADDEYFWGAYEGDWLDQLLFGKPAGEWTIQEYSNSKVMQWWARVRWLWRNPAYTFSRDYMGFERQAGCIERVYQVQIFGKSFIKTVWINTDGSKAFLLEGGFGFAPLNNIKWGWKAHKGFNKLMFADRIFSFRN